MYAGKEEEKEEVRGWKERIGSRMERGGKRKERKKGYDYGTGETKLREESGRRRMLWRLEDGKTGKEKVEAEA